MNEHGRYSREFHWLTLLVNHIFCSNIIAFVQQFLYSIVPKWTSKYGDKLKEFISNRSLKRKRQFLKEKERSLGDKTLLTWVWFTATMNEGTSFSSIASHQNYLQMVQKNCTHSIACTYCITFAFFFGLSHGGWCVSRFVLESSFELYSTTSTVKSRLPSHQLNKCNRSTEEKRNKSTTIVKSIFEI